MSEEDEQIYTHFHKMFPVLRVVTTLEAMKAT